MQIVVQIALCVTNGELRYTVPRVILNSSLPYLAHMRDVSLEINIYIFFYKLFTKYENTFVLKRHIYLIFMLCNSSAKFKIVNNRIELINLGTRSSKKKKLHGVAVIMSLRVRRDFILANLHKHTFCD